MSHLFRTAFLSAERGGGSFSLADSRANDDAVGIDKKVRLLSHLSDSLQADGDRQQSDQLRHMKFSLNVFSY